MAVYLLDGEVLTNSGSVATSEDCCCECSGACCDPFTFLCSIETLDDCTAAFGTWLGCNTTCAGVDCTCCPFFTFYNTLSFSGTVSGCDSGDIVFPEQVWTKVAPFPANPGAHEFATDSSCYFRAGTCSGIAANTYVSIDPNGDCVDTNLLTADFATACGPYVLFSGNIGNCQSGAPSTVVGASFEDLSSGSLTVSYVDTSLTPNVTFTFRLSVGP